MYLAPSLSNGTKVVAVGLDLRTSILVPKVSFLKLNERVDPATVYLAVPLTVRTKYEAPHLVVSAG